MKRQLIYVIVIFTIGCLAVLSIPCIIEYIASSSVEDISYMELNEMLDNKNGAFLMINKEGCPACEELKEMLKERKDSNHKLFSFEYSADRDDSFVDELQSVFPDFVVVPYICYVKNGKIEAYKGEREANEIFEWMDNHLAA